MIYFSLMIFLLTACSEKEATSTEILTKVEKTHDALESVYVDTEYIDHVNGSLSYNTIERYDFAHGIFLQEIEKENAFLYKGQQETRFLVDGEEMDTSQKDYDAQNFKVSYDMETERNPFKQLKQFDAHFYDHFIVAEENGVYIFTYDGEDEQKASIVKGMMWSNSIQANDLAESYEELELTDVDLGISADVDKKTNRIERFEIYMKYSPPAQFDTHLVEHTTIHRYSKYNEVSPIEKPEIGDIPSPIAEITLPAHEIEQYEKEAGQYVDALIQATVFQNVGEYVKRVPGSQSEEKKREDGAFQQMFFRAIYEENTLDNIAEAGVTKAQVRAFTDAFLDALTITKYEIENTSLQSDDTIEVTVSIQGIDNNAINEKVGKVAMAKYESGQLKEEEFVDRNLALLMEAYQSLDETMKPRDAVVQVSRSEDGTYEVLFQDQYLTTFVQQ